ncbi:MAG: lysylphosphatidylglycerol synthase transmembrane domain-containing protein [Sulfolobales archaeon]
MSLRDLESHVLLLVGLAAFIGYLFFIGFNNIIVLVLKLSPYTLALVLLTMILGMILHALTWFFSLISNRFERGVRVRDCIGITGVSLLSGYLLPVGAVTDIVRVVLSMRRMNLKPSTAISSVILHRLYLSLSGLILFVAIYLLGFLLYGTHLKSAQLLIITFYVALVILPTLAFAGIIGSSFFRNFMYKITIFVEKKFSRKYSFNPEIFVYEYRDSLKRSFTSIPYSSLAFTTSIGEWFLLTVTTYLIISGFTTYTSIMESFTVALSVQLIYWIMPLSFSSSIGLLELFMTLLLQLSGLSPQVAASFVILYRIFGFLAIFTLSYPALRAMKIRRLKDLIEPISSGYYEDRGMREMSQNRK